MYKQVKYSCIYKKSPPSYAEHLQKIENRYTGNVQNYLATLELLQKGEIQEILPPPDFIRAVTDDSYTEKNLKPKSPENHGPKIGSNSENDDGDGIPTVLEINDMLLTVRNKYEREVSYSLKRIQDLLNNNAKNRKLQIMITLENSFTNQCPIF